jgi:hydrophobic/amphiphilic exporter-1 (mainly G- bacteria), HAE1 family
MKHLPAGVQEAAVGQTQQIQELFGALGLAFFTGVAMIYGVLVLLFRSFFKPIIIISALPLAIFGAAIALFITRESVSIPSLIGVLMLLGIAAKNSILLVEYAIEREREGMPQREAIMEACRERARPIIMTSLAMIAGMIPTALALGKGSEFRQPMAIAVIGGLITSTLLALVMVPVIYEIVDDIEHWLVPKLARFATPRDAPPPVAAPTPAPAVDAAAE